MADFYHLTITPLDSVTQEEIEDVLNGAIDWYRYRAHTWIVYSSRSAAEWYAMLKDKVVPDGIMFMCKIDHQARSGYMATRFWEWLKKPRARTVD